LGQCFDLPAWYGRSRKIFQPELASLAKQVRSDLALLNGLRNIPSSRPRLRAASTIHGYRFVQS
jgi:hypothetical protein